MYKYPDKNDALTIELIESVSIGNYWADSEDRILAHILSMLNENGKHLDMGCGMGRLIEPFLKRSNSVVSVEPDKERFSYALEECKRLSNKYPEKEIVCINGDISNVLDLAFTSAISSHVIQHIPSNISNEMLKGIYDLLDENGLLFLSTTYSFDRDRYSKEYFEDGRRVSLEISKDEFENFSNEEGILPVAYFTSDTVIDKVCSIGFELVEYSCYHFSGLEDSKMDQILNEKKELEKARDAFYIFKKK